MRIVIKAKELERTQGKLSQNLVPVMAKGISRIATIERDYARLEAPQLTGKFIAAISRTKVSDLSWNVFEGKKKLGLWIREGTIGHSIFPRKAKALYWVGLPHPIAWTPHPGTKPNRYDERAVDRAEGDVRTEVELLELNLAKKMGG